MGRFAQWNERRRETRATRQIANGVWWLNACFPEWRQYINIDTLLIGSDSEKSIIGQLLPHAPSRAHSQLCMLTYLDRWRLGFYADKWHERARRRRLWKEALLT